MNAAEQQIKDWHEEEMERLFQEEQQAKRIERIERDDEYINNVLLPGLHAFWADVQKMVKVIEEKAA